MNDGFNILDSTIKEVRALGEFDKLKKERDETLMDEDLVEIDISAHSKDMDWCPEIKLMIKNAEEKARHDGFEVGKRQGANDKTILELKDFLIKLGKGSFDFNIRGDISSNKIHNYVEKRLEELEKVG